jgi:hypothetical protein
MAIRGGDTMNINEKEIKRGCCNQCGYKADYITDNNNFENKGYKNINEVPIDDMLCGACYEAVTQ